MPASEGVPSDASRVEVRPETLLSTSSAEKPDGSALRRVARNLASLGPFALVFATYSLLLDHLPSAWFTNDLVRYGAAVLGALCVGLLLRAAVQTAPVRRLIGEPSTPVMMFLPGPRAAPDADDETVASILAGTRRRLVQDCRTGSRNGVETLGWSQFLNDAVAPSAIGTSYGVRLALLLDVRDAAVDRGRLLTTLLTLQRPGGGWVGRTQGDSARPEVTAWVGVAAARLGVPEAERMKIVALLENVTNATEDPVGHRRVTVLSSVIAALVELAPRSPSLVRTVDALIDGATSVPGVPGRIAWGEVCGSSLASAPHTARAVVALQMASAAMPGPNRISSRVAAGLNWLRSNENLEPVEEQLIRRPAGDDAEVLVVGHFTAAWIARALLLSGSPVDSQRALRAAVRSVVSTQKDGVWRWGNTEREPLWMTYQGAYVLSRYALAGLPWPP